MTLLSHAPALPAGTSPDPSAQAGKRARPARGTAAAAVLLLAFATAAAAALIMTFPGLAHSVTGRIPQGKAALLVPAGAIGALVTGAYACQAVRAWLSEARIADTLTNVAALLATCASASGMWEFFTRFVSHSVVERASLFPFLEVCAIALAVRARTRRRKGKPARADLRGMWAATLLSAMLAATAATSPAEAAFRLTTPLAAAWMWERAIASDSRLASESHDARELSAWLADGRLWVLSRLSMDRQKARPTEVPPVRQLVIDLALAAEQAGMLRTDGAARWWRRAAKRRADRRLRSANRAAAPYLADNREEREYLDRLVGQLGSCDDLAAAAAAASRWKWLSGDPGAQGDDQSAAEDLGELCRGLAEALQRKDYDAIHQALAGRDDYVELVRLIAGRDMSGGKQLLALTALCAKPECQVPSQIAGWIAQQIKGVPGLGEYAIPDQAEITRVLDALAVNAARHDSPGTRFGQAAA